MIKKILKSLIFIDEGRCLYCGDRYSFSDLSGAFSYADSLAALLARHGNAAFNSTSDSAKTLTRKDSGLCPDCMARLDKTSGVWELDKGHIAFSAIFYNNFLKDMVAAYKFSKASFYERLFRYLLGEFLDKQAFFKNFSAVSFIPGKKKTEIMRGAYPAKALAEETALRLKIPLIDTMDKVGHRRAQKTLSAHDRHMNVKGAFTLKKTFKLLNSKDLICGDGRKADSTIGGGALMGRGLSNSFAGSADDSRLCRGIFTRPIILVDDFKTTGATITEGLETLKRAGIEGVGLCLASAGMPDFDKRI